MLAGFQAMNKIIINKIDLDKWSFQNSIYYPSYRTRCGISFGLPRYARNDGEF